MDIVLKLLLAEKERLTHQLEEVDSALDSFYKSNSQQSFKEPIIKRTSIKGKIINILSASEEPLSFQEIVDRLYNDGCKARKSSISTILSHLRKENVVTRQRNGNALLRYRITNNNAGCLPYFVGQA